MDNVGDVRGGVVGQEESVVGWELEDVARCEAGEDEAGHQLGICDSEAVTAHQADVLVHSGPGHRTQHVARHQICNVRAVIIEQYYWWDNTSKNKNTLKHIRYQPKY